MTKNQETGMWALAGMFLVGVGVGLMWWPLVFVWLGACCLFMAISRAMRAVESDESREQAVIRRGLETALKEHFQERHDG